MFRIAALALLCCAFSASAANPPKDLQPLPEAPSQSGPDSLEPEITIIERSEATIEEYRIRGRMYMIKVTPRLGPAYYLIDDRGDGNFLRYEGLDSGLQVPRWVIKEF
jgi:hypothetical protein